MSTNKHDVTADINSKQQVTSALETVDDQTPGVESVAVCRFKFTESLSKV